MTDTKYVIYPVDRASFDPRRLGPIRHTYDTHPLLQLDALEGLAHRLLPNGNSRFAAPGAKPDSEFKHYPEPTDGRSIREIFRDMEQPGSWVALYDVQTDPQYRALLDSVRGNMQEVLGRRQHVFDVRGFIFVSAPPAVTPFHIDRENNFWLQIRGRKQLYLWDREDRSVVAAPDLEEFIMFGALHNVRMHDDTLAKSVRFDCGPGDGAYFPSTTPHMTQSHRDWVTPGDGVSISIGMVFYTDVTRRHARTHALNWQLRRFGLDPMGPGRLDLVDRLKEPAGRTMVRLRQRFRGYRPPPGIV